MTIAHLALKYHKLDIFEILVIKYKVNPFVIDISNKTPIDYISKEY